MKKAKFPHRHTAVACTDEGFPVAPRNLYALSGDFTQVTTNSDEANCWWTGKFKNLNALLPVGSMSGVIGLVINQTHGKSKQNGFPALFRLQAQYGELQATAFIDDGEQWTLLYECPKDFVIAGTTEIAPGITVIGNGHWITLPPYHCKETGKVIEWPSKYRLTRDNLTKAPHWIIDLVTAQQLDSSELGADHEAVLTMRTLAAA